MSLKSVCAVFDRAAQLFGQPVFANNANEVLRSFSDECNRPKTASGQPNVYYEHPEHFELFELGSFDDNNGAFLMGAGMPRLISLAGDLKKPVS